MTAVPGRRCSTMRGGEAARAAAGSDRRGRPWTVTALGVFFALGAAISSLTIVALLLPGGVLDPMWRLNSRAREQFAIMGGWAFALMAVVSTACAFTAYGLWRGRRFGFVLGLTMLAVSLVGDLANALLGIEPRAWVGVPIAAALFVTLATGRAREFFVAESRSAHSDRATHPQGGRRTPI